MSRTPMPSLTPDVMARIMGMSGNQSSVRRLNKSLASETMHMTAVLHSSLSEQRLVFTKACEAGNINVVRVMLANGLDPSYNRNEAIIAASANNQPRIVSELLRNPNVDPSSNRNRAIIEASKRGHHNVVRILLKDKRVDPTDQDEEAIINACFKGHLEVVKLLLSDKRVNPARYMPRPLTLACMSPVGPKANYIKIVKLLLMDKRVDPTVNGNEAMVQAATHSNYEIVQILLDAITKKPQFRRSV